MLINNVLKNKLTKDLKIVGKIRMELSLVSYRKKKFFWNYFLLLNIPKMLNEIKIITKLFPTLKIGMEGQNLERLDVSS